MKPGDLMTITGCADDRQCGIGQECVHGTEGMQGAGGVAQAAGSLPLSLSALPG